MKLKVLLLSFLLGIGLTATAYSDPEGHRWHGSYHEGHSGLAFLGGLLLGGVLAHEIDGRYYDDYHREVVRVRECHPQQVVDSWGRLMYDRYGNPIMQEVCYDRWQRVDAPVVIEQPPQ